MEVNAFQKLGRWILLVTLASGASASATGPCSRDSPGEAVLVFDAVAHGVDDGQLQHMKTFAKGLVDESVKDGSFAIEGLVTFADDGSDGVVTRTLFSTDATEIKDRIDFPDRVNGEFGAWDAWGKCSATCGGGLRSRARTCDNPAPSNGGSDCAGDATEQEDCDSEVTCPGGFSKKSTSKKSSENGRRRRSPKKSPGRENSEEDFEVLDEDEFVYCDECDKEFNDHCTNHGAYKEVSDTAGPDVRLGDPQHAVRTLPPGLAVRVSSNPTPARASLPRRPSLQRRASAPTRARGSRTPNRRKRQATAGRSDF